MASTTDDERTDGAPGRPRGLATGDVLARVHDVALLDLDGVVYVGAAAVPGAVEQLVEAGKAGLRLGYVTNNASRPPGEVAAHLREVGIELDDSDVVTSAQAAARLVAERVPAAARVLVVGGDGLDAALAEHGLRPVRSLHDDPAAVVQGFHPTIDWQQLAEGAYAVASGLPWVASNLDRTVPTPRGIAPGNGTLVAAVREATGVAPLVAGKPEPALVAESVLRTGAQRPLMVGDRLDTDVSGATRFGMPSLLVLTGVTGLEQLLAATGEQRPDYVAPDLSGLLVAHPRVRLEPEHGVLAAHCGGWSAYVDAGCSWLEQPPPVGDAPSSEGAVLAALRAAVGAAWSARDHGAPVEDTDALVDRLGEMMQT